MKTAILKVSDELDFVTLTNNGGLIARWPKTNKEALTLARLELFAEAWKLSEMGWKIELNPYIN